MGGRDIAGKVWSMGGRDIAGKVWSMSGKGRAGKVWSMGVRDIPYTNYPEMKLLQIL